MLGHRRFEHWGLVRGGLAGHREQVSRELQPVWKTPARPVRAPAAPCVYAPGDRQAVR